MRKKFEQDNALKEHYYAHDIVDPSNYFFKQL